MSLRVFFSSLRVFAFGTFTEYLSVFAQCGCLCPVFAVPPSLRFLACLCVSLRVFACLCASLRVFARLCVSLRVFACLCVSLRSLGVFAVFR